MFGFEYESLLYHVKKLNQVLIRVLVGDAGVLKVFCNPARVKLNASRLRKEFGRRIRYVFAQLRHAEFILLQRFSSSGASCLLTCSPIAQSAGGRPRAGFNLSITRGQPW